MLEIKRYAALTYPAIAPSGSGRFSIRIQQEHISDGFKRRRRRQTGSTAARFKPPQLKPVEFGFVTRHPGATRRPFLPPPPALAMIDWCRGREAIACRKISVFRQ